jgi:hypothetical protein
MDEKEWQTREALVNELYALKSEMGWHRFYAENFFARKAVEKYPDEAQRELKMWEHHERQSIREYNWFVFETLEQHRRDWVWSLNSMLYLGLADFRRGLATDVLFRTDDHIVRRTLEEATAATYDRFLSEVSPLLRFELRLFDTPALPVLVRHPITSRADILCIDGVGREPGEVGGYPPSGGVSRSAIRALEDCPYLDNMEAIVVMGVAPEAREQFAGFVQRHPQAKEWL